MNRRRFLRGSAGAMLALPLLESLRPRRTWANDPVAPKRALWWFTPNGHNMFDWTPGETGVGYTMSPILTPFEPFRDKMTVISGLRNYGVAPIGESCEGHDGAAAWLNCSSISGGGNVSIDQLLAAQVGPDTIFNSLELGMAPIAGNHGASISWTGPNQPMPIVVSAPALFARLFGSAGTMSPEEIERRTSLRLSVLDGVLEDLNSLQPRLPNSDKIKLEQYSTALRELELRIEQSAESACDIGEPPSEHGFDEMCSVMALAFECDLTRVMTFMLQNEANNMAHTHLGIPENYHALSHHAFDPDILAKLTTIQTWQAQIFADSILTRFEEMVDVDGNSLLDNTTILYGSGLGDGNYHDNFDLPSALFGGTHTFTHGHHLMATDEPLADLHLAICAANGVNIPSLGPASTGPLAGLS